MLLWRLEGFTAERVTRPERLAEGLAAHLAHATLTSVLVQIASDQRGYVMLPGCPTCLRGRCQPGCPTDLLRRLLSACVPGVTLHPITKGLATRPYNEVRLAWPTRESQPLDATWLQSWPEARIQLQYAAGIRPRVAALIAVGDSELNLRDSLHKRGWRSVPVIRPLARRLISPLPMQLWFPQHLASPPELLMPVGAARSLHIYDQLKHSLPVVTTSHSSELEAPSPDLRDDAPSSGELPARLLADLRAMLAGEAPFRRIATAAAAPTSTAINGEAPAELDPSPFPPGPGSGKSAMRPHDVEAWIEGMLAHPQGYTRKTIAALLGEPHREHAATLLCWLDQAALLSAPTDPTQPARYPRALIITDHALIAERLRATPLPDEVTLRAAKGLGS